MTRLAAIVFALLVGLTARAGEIALRPSARLTPGAPVTLGDVATLTGDDAAALAPTALDVRRGSDGAAEITVEDVRAALDAAGVNWGRLTLRGSVCAVRAAEPTPATPDAPRRARSRDEPAAVDLAGPPTVRTRLARLVARLYGVTPDNLRLRFDERDAEFLSTPESGRRIEIQPAATPNASRFSAVVWLYAGDELLGSRSVRVDVRVRRPVVVLTRALDRGDAVTPDAVRSETLWVEPAGSAMVGAVEDAVGAVARKRLDAGAILRAEALEPPIVVRRGELVTVHCVSGGVVVKAKARAARDGRAGERLELRMDGSKKTFVARVVAPGRAVVNLDAPASLAEAAP